MTRMGARATQPPKGRKRWRIGPHVTYRRKATANYWEKEEVGISGWDRLCVPHTDGWHAQTDLPIIATTACLASTVHCPGRGQIQAPQWGHFQAHAHI